MLFLLKEEDNTEDKNQNGSGTVGLHHLKIKIMLKKLVKKYLNLLNKNSLHSVKDLLLG